MFLIGVFFVWMGIAVGFFVGKSLLAPLLLPLAHLIDQAAGYEISKFFRKLFLSANEPEFILAGDPLKLPVTAICIGISMWLGATIFKGISDAFSDKNAGSDDQSDSE